MAEQALATDIQGLLLRGLGEGDVNDLSQLVCANAAHLTRLGDYPDLVAKSAEELAVSLQQSGEECFGLFLQGRLIGTVTLIHYGNHVFGLGYWIDQAYSRQGLTTAAVQRIVDYARVEHTAREVWAGIKHGNVASIHVVKKLGFELLREQPTHLSYCKTF